MCQEPSGDAAMRQIGHTLFPAPALVVPNENFDPDRVQIADMEGTLAFSTSDQVIKSGRFLPEGVSASVGDRSILR